MKCAAPVWFDEHTQAAFRALDMGTANESQQQLITSFLTNELCGLRFMSFQSTDRETAFMEGRKFVGRHIAYMIDPTTKPPAGAKPRQEAHD